MITLTKVNKFFGRHHVLKDLTFTVKSGKITAFLGVNGAGKTTTMRLINGVLDPDSGQIRIGHYNPATQPLKVKRLIGYLPENNPLYTHLRVSEYLHFIAQVYDLSNFPLAYTQIFTQTGIQSIWDKKIETLSRGLKQRVGLTAALIHQPKVLVLDEPLAGLDPLQKQEIIQLLKTLATQTTILFSTHVLSEVEQLCHDVIIIHQGKILLSDSLANLKGKHTQVTVIYQGPKKIIRLLVQKHPNIKLTHQFSPRKGQWQLTLNLPTTKTDSYLKLISTAITQNQGILLRLDTQTQNLSTLFTQLTTQHAV